MTVDLPPTDVVPDALECGIADNARVKAGRVGERSGHVARPVEDKGGGEERGEEGL